MHADAFFPTLAENGRFLKMLHQSGIPLQDEVGRYVFAKHGAGKALASWVNMYAKGYLPKEALTQGHQDVMDRYQSGSLAMFVAGTTALASIQKNAPTVYQHTQVSRQFPEQVGQSSNPDFSVMTLVVPKTTEHPKEAIALALALTNAKNTLAFSKLAPILPPNTSALEQSIAKTKHSDLLEEARYLSATQLLHSKSAFQIHPRQKSVNQIVDFYVQSALLGKLSAEDAMQQAQDKINNMLKN